MRLCPAIRRYPDWVGSALIWSCGARRWRSANKWRASRSRNARHRQRANEHWPLSTSKKKQQAEARTCGGAGAAESHRLVATISNSTTDLQLILDTIVRAAGRLCDAEFSLIYKLQDGQYHMAVTNNKRREPLSNMPRRHPLAPGRGTLIGRTAFEQDDPSSAGLPGRSRICGAGVPARRKTTARCLVCPCDRAVRRSASSALMSAPCCGPLPNGKSNWSRPSPTRR